MSDPRLFPGAGWRAGIIVAAATALVAALPMPANAADVTDGSDVPTQRLIVKFRDGPTATRQSLSASGRVAALAAEGGVTLKTLRTMALGAHVVELGSAVPLREARAIAQRLAASADVEYVEPDRRVRAKRVPNDALFSQQQAYLGNGANAIAAVGAWDTTTGSASTVVAVLDTGYRPHADLAGRILPGYDFIIDIPTANDGDARDADASDPGDWVTQADIDGPFRGQGCTVENSSWHGTNVAGVILANSNNNSYIAGIDWAARLLPVRVLGKCGGYLSDTADAMIWASGGNVPGVPANANPAQIINLSLGGEGGPCSATSQAAINAALAGGSTRAIIAVAGNESTDVATSEPGNCDGVITVAATNSLGNRASYSNFGTRVTISAPGGDPAAVANDRITVIDNSGLTVPQADTTAQVAGTSFSAPMVAGVVSLMLSVAPNLTAAQVRSVLTSTAHAFPAGSTCSTATCGAGIVNAQAAVLAAQSLSGGGGGTNYQGLWWATGGLESGWGINFAHQRDTIFATWFTYDTTGKAWWLTMTATKTGDGVYSGTLLQTNGPAFNAVPFSPAQVSYTPVGNGTITFSGPRTGSFAYTITSVVPPVTQLKTIELQVFGTVPTCVWGEQTDLTTATNYQDLWWVAGGQESGWGINLTHQGTTIFATWFTYDVNHNPLWYSVTAPQTAPGTYTGRLLRTTGPAFNAVPFSPSAVQRVDVGTTTLSFGNGNAGNFSYQVNDGANVGTQTKAITRQVFAAPGTVCH